MKILEVINKKYSFRVLFLLGLVGLGLVQLIYGLSSKSSFNYLYGAWSTEAHLKLLAVFSITMTYAFISFRLLKKIHPILFLIGWLLYLIGAGPSAGVIFASLLILILGKAFNKLFNLKVENHGNDFFIGLAFIVFFLYIAAFFGYFNWTLIIFLIILCLILAYISNLDVRKTISSTILWSENSENPFVYLTLLAAAILLAVSCNPETGHDSLVLHLAIPKYIYANGAWHFDVTRNILSVVPSGVDFLFSYFYFFSGEQGSRLCNFICIIALLATMNDFLFQRKDRWLVFAGILTYPILYLEMSSLFVEAVWASTFAAGMIYFLNGVELKSKNYFYIGAILLCSSASMKLPSLIVFPFLFLYFITRFWSSKLFLSLITFFLVLACPPYLIAYYKTGNPLFPFFNKIFKSSFYDTAQNFNNQLFNSQFSIGWLYDLTFDSSKFIEGSSGANGLFFLVMLYPVLFSLFRYRKALGLISLVFFIITWLQQSYLRYTLPFFLITLFGVEALLKEFEGHYKVQSITKLIFFILFSASLLLMPTSGWYGRHLYVLPKDYDLYLSTRAPERLAAKYLDQNFRASKVFFVGNSWWADFQGYAVGNRWYNPNFESQLNQLTNDIQIKNFLTSTNINFIVYNKTRVLEETLPLQKYISSCNLFRNFYDAYICTVEP